MPRPLQDPESLRAQAAKLQQDAKTAEAEAAKAQARAEAMKPEWRVAELLHDEFAIGYPGAGGAMDGGDPWYYEIPPQPARMALERELAQTWSGGEHQRFVKMASTLRSLWCRTPMLPDADDYARDYVEIESRLNDLRIMLGNYTWGGARRKQSDRTERGVKRHRDDAVKAVDKAIEEALKVMP